MYCPRASTSFRPVAKSNVPAAVCAVNSPSESPAAAADGEVARRGPQGGEGGKTVDEKARAGSWRCASVRFERALRKASFERGRPRISSPWAKTAAAAGDAAHRGRGPCRPPANLARKRGVRFYQPSGTKKEFEVLSKGAIVCAPMPKSVARRKTKKSAAKRFKITGTGKILFAHSWPPPHPAKQERQAQAPARQARRRPQDGHAAHQGLPAVRLREAWTCRSSSSF